jgi:hypothetical protein
MSLHRWQDGGFLTTIKAQPEYSWVRNKFGTCSFDLSLNDFKATRKYMEFGVLLFIENATLGNWGGVIDPDEDWNQDGTISKNAYSGEYLLTFRRSPMNQLFRDASAGGLFKQFIDEANKAQDLLIREGSIWRGGTAAEDTMDAKDFYTHAKALAENRNYDWCIEPALDSAGRLYFRANFYERRGEVKTLTLKEGFNITKGSKPLKVQRKIVNDLLGIGAGSDAERAVWNEVDAESRDRYGLRQGSEDFPGNVNLGTLKANTVEKLRVLRNPRRTFDFSATDVEGTYQALRVGNILPLKLQSVGFLDDDRIGADTQVQINGMRHVTKADVVELTIDEVVI